MQARLQLGSGLVLAIQAAHVNLRWAALVQPACLPCVGSACP